MSTITNVLLRVAAGIAALAAVQGAKAVDVCATTSQELQHDLDVAANSTQHDMTIRVLEGTYSLTTSSIDAKASLSIEGGYIDCNTRDPKVSPAKTFLNFNGGGVSIYSSSDSSAAHLTLDGVTLANAFFVSLVGGDPYVDHLVGHLTLKRTTIFSTGRVDVEVTCGGFL